MVSPSPFSIPRLPVLTVYLAGSLDETYYSWRSAARNALTAAKFKLLDPSKYQDVDLAARSLTDLESADLILACCARPTWSTGMEIFRAAQLQKPVVCFAVGEVISPWILQHSTCQVQTLTAAVEKLESIRQILTELGEQCEGCLERASLVRFELDDSATLKLCPKCIRSVST